MKNIKLIILVVASVAAIFAFLLYRHSRAPLTTATSQFFRRVVRFQRPECARTPARWVGRSPCP
ncbi:hypothetical protein M4R23_25405, partial [Acidovorax sp. GBBC 3332]